MLGLDQSVLDEILARKGAATSDSATDRVDALCRWWNSSAPDGRTGATHFGIYVESDGTCRNVDTQDRTIRFTHRFEEAGSSARCGDFIIEFRRGEECGPNDYVAFDFAGNAIESNRIGLDKFREWSGQAVDRLMALPGRFGRHDEEGRKACVPNVE